MSALAKGLIASGAMGRRELIRMTRQPSRIVAAIATPLLVWAFIAGGFSDAVGGRGIALGSMMIPGIASLTVMFSSIFASISLIEDRHGGFLRAALLSPAPRWGIVLAKVWSGSLVGVAQGAVVLALLPITGHTPSVLGALGALGGLACVSAALIGLGLCFAWVVDSTQGFHGVMNGVLMPLWLTSGAVFPVNDASPWLRTVALCNPLTWMHAAMRRSLAMEGVRGAPGWVAWVVCVSAALLCVLLATRAMLARSGRP